MRTVASWFESAWFVLALAMPLAAAEGLPHGDARVLGFDATKLAAVSAMFDEAVAGEQITGGAALVARRGEIALLATAGIADREAGRPIAADTIYRIASMTKPITTVAVLMLVDEGKIKLDDPLSKFVPEFGAVRVLARGASDTADATPATVAASRAITIHDLLTHTSGLSYRFFGKEPIAGLYVEAGVSDGLTETEGTIADNVRRLASAPLMFQPGGNWEYSLATDVLGRVVEVASNLTLAEFFHSRIFTPLAMHDTSFVVPSDKRSRLAAVYAPGDDKKLHRLPNEPIQAGALVYSATYSTWDASRYYSGGAGLCSTIGDYARLLEMLRRGGELDGVRLLKTETVALATKNQIGDFAVAFPGHGDRFGYGFGVVTDARPKDERSVHGSFSWGGFWGTYFWVDPANELTCVLMAQVYPNDHLKLREEMKRRVYESLR